MYEMVAGRPPFLGDDDIAILGQHINTPPVAPQWHRSEIPAQLNSLIMRLLSKNPAERPDSAADVLVAVKAIDLSSASNLSQGSGASESETGSLDSMAAGVFVGRHAEMDQLKAKLENALSGRDVDTGGGAWYRQDSHVAGTRNLRRTSKCPGVVGALLRRRQRASILALGASDTELRGGPRSRRTPA